MLNSNYYTIKNTKSIDKPNEDCSLCDDEHGIYIILDGVSRDKVNGKYPNPSPAAELSKIVLDYIYNELLNQISDGKIDIYKAIFNANLIAKQYNANNVEIIDNFLAGTVGIVCVITGDVLNYGYIGDCIGKIINDNNIYEFTTMQTLNIAKHKGEFSAFEIRNVICNNEKHFCGYGVINGQKGVKHFIKTGKIVLKRSSCVLLSSDGCEEIFEKASIEELKTLSTEKLVTKYTTENNADDRTMIIIKQNFIEVNINDNDI